MAKLPIFGTLLAVCLNMPYTSGSVAKTCLICGKEFYPPPSKLNTAKFCSVKCRGIAGQNRVEKVCPTCGMKFWVVQTANAKRQCCSRKCAYPKCLDIDLELVPKICPICKKSFILKRATSHRIATFCSKKCAGESLKTHGLQKTPEYNSWAGMWNRCTNSNEPAYKNWGGRGITVCERWRSFENFLADMGLKPSSEHSIDRYPDNNGNYEPGNCRWATAKEQRHNQRKMQFITFNGETLSITDWANKLEINFHTLHGRLARGWSIEFALTEPVRKMWKNNK